MHDLSFIVFYFFEHEAGVSFQIGLLLLKKFLQFFQLADLLLHEVNVLVISVEFFFYFQECLLDLVIDKFVRIRLLRAGQPRLYRV